MWIMNIIPVKRQKSDSKQLFTMRRRIPYRVCSCMPNGVVTHLEARLLKKLVNREIHPIRCAASCKQKFMKGSRIGDLCAETGHFVWALKVWHFTARLIEDKDIEDWMYVRFDNDRVQLTDVISETEYELLTKRCSDLCRSLDICPEYWWTERKEHLASRTFGTSYSYLFAEKYDGNWYPDQIQEEWEEEMAEYRREQDTDILFREGQGDNLPPCSSDFFEYWHDGPHREDVLA